MCCMYGGLRDYTFHNHHQHRRRHQDQIQHLHLGGSDYCGESSWADLEMADWEMADLEMAGGGVGWRSKCWDQLGGHTCVQYQVDMLRRGRLRALPQNC